MLCICGILGKGTLRKYPFSRVPTARVHMGEDIYMYQRSASSSFESMNNANKAVRERTAVDPVNSSMLLL